MPNRDRAAPSNRGLSRYLSVDARGPGTSATAMNAAVIAPPPAIAAGTIAVWRLFSELALTQIMPFT